MPTSLSSALFHEVRPEFFRETELPHRALHSLAKMTQTPPAPNANGLFARLSEADRERLGEALRRLMASGSILGTEPGQTELYHWCHVNREWVEELAALLDLKHHPFGLAG